MSLGWRHKTSSYCQRHLINSLAEEKVIIYVSEFKKQRFSEANRYSPSQDIPCHL